jgi:hypothetical protein
MAILDQNIPTQGMSNDHPMNLKDSQYPLMVNGNIQTDIAGPITLTNEHSNISCLQEKFDVGYKLIGSLFVPENDVTYVFLTDGSGNSEIGFVSECNFIDRTDIPTQDPCDQCETINVELPPLETQTQEPCCTYTCISKATCLNFNIDFPIRKPVYKKDNCGGTLYFTDFLNPIRALKLTPDNTLDDSVREVDYYYCEGSEISYSTCEIAPCSCCRIAYKDYCTSEDLDCFKIRLFPEVKHLCIKPLSVNAGGSLRAGTYQLAACYTDSNGQKATRAFSCSNPISVFDPNQTVTTETSYPTNLSVKFSINDLDPTLYQYINIYIVATINRVASVKQYGPIDISAVQNGTFIYTVSDFEKGIDVTIDDVLQILPVYDKAQEITTAGNVLLLGNLTAPRDLNLQKAVIGLSSNVRWATSEANEWFYRDGAADANYRGYLRDEVYPLGIVFERNNTLDTCVYPFVGREINHAFGLVETAEDVNGCVEEWENMFTDASATFQSSIGSSIFNYVGEWIPTRAYTPRNVPRPTDPYEVVSYQGVYYVATTLIPVGDSPLTNSAWLEVTVPDSCFFCSIIENSIVTNNDALVPPGCDNGRGSIPGNQANYSNFWRVYNTAYNLGLTCSPERDKVTCVDKFEDISCSSYTFTVPTLSAAWNAGGPGPIRFETTLSPVGNIAVGSQIHSSKFPNNATVIVTSLDASGVDASADILIPAYGDTIGLTTTATISFTISCDASGLDCSGTDYCTPNDCYIDRDNKCIPCSNNYMTAINEIAHCLSQWQSTYFYSIGNIVYYDGSAFTAVVDGSGSIPGASLAWSDGTASASGGCDCPVWPPVDAIAVVDSSGCNPGFVRTRTDALNYFDASGSYLLCIDATLAGYSNNLADPFAVKLSSEPVKILDASTKDWYIYDVTGIQDVIIPSSDPTSKFMVGTKGPEDPVCLNGLKLLNPAGQPVLNYLFSGINLPDTEPSNYTPTNDVAIFTPSPENKCNDYGPSAPLMYMLGNNLTTPTVPPDCCTGSGENCEWTDSDYWNIAATPAITGEVNNTKYQSYWYSFIATGSQPTIIIKSKIGYKFGEFILFAPSPVHIPTPDDYQEPGDFRIDVYEDNFSGTPKWSTGPDSINPATYYYTGSYEDIGVLVIGDVANSTGLPTTANQLPLITGKTYYVHIYLLQQGIDKVNKAPIGNPNKSDPCISYDATGGSSCCPCYFANYAYLNLCINSATSDNKRSVSLPETWELDCDYRIFYREYELIDNGCAVQTFEYGNFAFWQSLNTTYPTSTYINSNGEERAIWGDLCGQPIRHFKFPDVYVSKVQNQDLLINFDTLGNPVSRPFNPGRTAKIYPLGVRVDPIDVKAWLDWAALDEVSGGGGLITQEERDSITGYKIVRGNRVGNKSVVGKGLLFDMFRYNQYDYINDSYANTFSYYANYPFNDLESDSYLVRAKKNIPAPFSGNGNNRYAFLSPETTFNSPTLGYELKLESVVFGDALGSFYEVRNHPKYSLLSSGGIALAASLAAIQLVADLLILTGQLIGPTWEVGTTFSIPVGSIIGTVGAGLNTVPNFFTYAARWRDIITNFGVPQNFAKYYAAVGNYHSSGEVGEVVNNIGEKRREVLNYSYLLGGNYSLSDSGILSRINNYLREDSVYLYLNKKFTYSNLPIKGPVSTDNSKFVMSSNHDNKECSLADRQSAVSSFYASVKYNVPDQYGYLQDIEWLYTGKCASLFDSNESVCALIYGGDTFISRMTQKRKIPFFITNTVGAQTGVDSLYRRISNITNAKYYFNSIGESAANSSSIQFKEVENSFDCENTGDGLYLKGTIYLFSYGIASFICESDFNLNFRYTTDDKFKTFYPFQSDIESWTQEYRVPIETPNYYQYNNDYSKQNKENFFCSQPGIYSNDLCLTTYKNRVINSQVDTDSDFYSDPWRIFLANDYKDFPLENGQLVGLDGVERDKLVLRFNKTTWVLNAYYTMTTDAGVAQIGAAGLFQQKPVEYAKTEIGYGGTQHHAFVTTQFGHFWVDAARSAIFMLPPGEGGIQEISLSLNTFFNNNLPFFILKAFPNYNVDNNYKEIGLAMGWDNKFDRLFLTKRDYELRSRYVGRVNYVDGKFIYTPIGGPAVEIFLTNSIYFCNKSWTVAYSPLTKSWISYYSFIPNFYIGHENYFQTGINFSQNNEPEELGLWNHLLTNKSYQVFYGNLYPFITDVVVKEQLINKQLQSIEYQADFLRFQNDYDYFYNPRVTFNKMVIWSENRNSGNLELVPQIPGNLSQSVLYPVVNSNSTSILVTRKENNWRVNEFWDLVRNKYNNVPPMQYNCHPYLKEVNPVAINYNKPTFERSRITSDYMYLRFINDQYSNYKIINKWFLNKIIKSYT